LYNGAAPPRLHDGDVGALGEQSQVVQLAQGFAVRAAIAEVAARHDDAVGRLPAALLQQLHHHRLLAFEPEGVHRVEDVDA
jgi:hypothetical protein